MIVKDIKSFILKATSVHNGLYDYSLSKYNGCRVKLDIICNKHGIFQKTPEKHLAGAGCQKCSYESTGEKLSIGLEEFILRSSKVHGNKYCYDKVSYKNNLTKVVIVCGKHGEFSQAPCSHMIGFGCPLCSYEGTVRDLGSFKEKATKVHNGLYGYDSSIYKNNTTKVEILCNTHGMFKQVPSNHLNGQGCPKCAKTGIIYNDPTYLYIINYEHLTKIGISNNNSRSRLKNIITNSKIEFKELKRYQFNDGYSASEAEKRVLRWLRKNYHNTPLKFDGRTECFEYVDLTKLLNLIEYKLGVI